MTKKYFSPAIHQQTAYKIFYDEYRDKLKNTEYVSNNILCLPIYSHMPEETVNKICEAIVRIKNFC
jgi:dTDP-4-amino-4,6-dideoxygalactose transaminase